MHKVVRTKFIKKYWFDIIQTDKGFYIFNTQRKRRPNERDGIGYVVPESEFETLNKAIKFLDKYEKEDYDI